MLLSLIPKSPPVLVLYSPRYIFLVHPVTFANVYPGTCETLRFQSRLYPGGYSGTHMEAPIFGKGLGECGGNPI